MRFIGNKASMLTDIEALLKEQNLLRPGMSFFDAFCGTGAVADYFKQYFDVIINDNVTWSVIYSKGRIVAQSCTFQTLGFDPFSFLNESCDCRHGFIYKNYSPAESDRMYFTPENAARIDYFREQIEQWRTAQKINENEYCYLMASLIESVSDVSNTAGVYGAFLKKWDPRALKAITFSRVDSFPTAVTNVSSFKDRIEDIIASVDCDILYLDPPYTQNQYGTQYHLLETLVLDDNPSISKITGSRSTAPMRSNWSKDIHCHILFDKVVAQTKAKYIILSYNSDGFMSKEFIEATLKRYGKPETYIRKRIPYKKYQNWKTSHADHHFEYLYFIEKKAAADVIYESPLNYIGNKAKIVPQIKKHITGVSPVFYDLFGGGFNVGINMPHPSIKYVELNPFVTELIEALRSYDTYEFILYIHKTIKKFGLKKGDPESYNKVRAYYNTMPVEKRDPRLLYTVILYGYQQQIRFNGSHEFNNPVGVRWFNDKVLEKFVSFSRRIKERDCQFLRLSYLDVEQDIGPECFVYMDPPYQLTTGAYNDGKRGFKGWNAALEAELFAFADRLDRRGVHFMLSYVAEHKGKQNEKLMDWVRKGSYTLINLGDIIGISGSRRKEVLIINYGV